MKRINKFVYFLHINNQKFIYDISTDTAAVLDPYLFDCIINNIDNIEKLHDIHPELYDKLLSANLVVDKDVDEASELLMHYKNVDCNPEVFDIIVNPTLDCNLRCWYCYENHRGGTSMKSDVLKSVERLIDNRLSENSIKKLSLSFFGGEPMLGWNKVVTPLIEFAVSKCKESDVLFSTSFTTNGVLLSESKYNFLSSLDLNRTVFQITFDGNRSLHNESRIGVNRIPTYDVIMNNVKLGASKGFQMNLRFNYTPETLSSFTDVLADLSDIPSEFRQNIFCNFQKVWQAGNNKTKELAVEYVNMFNNAGFSATCEHNYRRHTCYADRENQVTINYNGDVFKCTAREFDSSSREGLLHTDGSIEFNDRYYKRMDSKYSNPYCRSCEILPLCNGGCSQGKIESEQDSLCYRQYDSKTKQSIIIGAFCLKVFKRILTTDELSSLNYKIYHL